MKPGGSPSPGQSQRGTCYHTLGHLLLSCLRGPHMVLPMMFLLSQNCQLPVASEFRSRVPVSTLDEHQKAICTATHRPGRLLPPPWCCCPGKMVLQMLCLNIARGRLSVLRTKLVLNHAKRSVVFGDIYAAGKIFTRPLIATVKTNFNSGK